MNQLVNFLDGEQRDEQYPDDFPIPSKEEKDALEIGDWVKVGLEDYPTEQLLKGERFWVELTAIDGLRLTGTVINDLEFADDHGVDYGDTLSFEMRHVIDIDPQWEEGVEGVTFIDGEECHQQHPETFIIPTKEQKQALKVGDDVCVGLKAALDIPGERFWVELTAINGSTVMNDLILAEVFGVDYGDTLSFESKHVLTIRPQAPLTEVTPEAARSFLRGS